MNPIKNLILIFMLLSQTITAQNENVPYLQQIEQWHAKRVANLKSESGWLTVAGLYWLKEGENSVGSAKYNQVVFPKGKAAEKIGVFTLNHGEVKLSVVQGVSVMQKDSLFTSGIIFNDKIGEQEVILSHKNLRFFIIKRGDKYGIRLKDIESDARKSFTHIDRFPVAETWRVVASYEAPKEVKTIPIHDVIGLTTETPYGGTLHFELNGKKYQLDATLEEDDLFIVFADETSGVTTYGGGRFLYAKVPKQGTEVILDFNKAYNPPCAFTDFATCPLPPDQNKLALEITAGEKAYNRH
ncbi:MAG: DUF1684 domain-containing protein [Bacteroidetes bacterium]|nr:DUF1684 domain-containing protein [Bacteroidota bacterium]